MKKPISTHFAIDVRFGIWNERIILKDLPIVRLLEGTEASHARHGNGREATIATLQQRIGEEKRRKGQLMGTVTEDILFKLR